MARIMSGSSDAWKQFNGRMQAYWEKRQTVHDTLALFSPTMNYETITSSVTYKTASSAMAVGPGSGKVVSASFSIAEKQETCVENILGKILANIVALLLFPVVFFGLAYVRFMRLDVR